MRVPREVRSPDLQLDGPSVDEVDLAWPRVAAAGKLRAPAGDQSVEAWLHGLRLIDIAPRSKPLVFGRRRKYVRTPIAGLDQRLDILTLQIGIGWCGQNELPQFGCIHSDSLSQRSLRPGNNVASLCRLREKRSRGRGASIAGLHL
jgi:hypothetical protein